MTVFATLVFWLSISLIGYTYFGYALLLKLVAPISNSNGTATESKDCPSVTMIVAAYNEESFIREKVENALACDYPHSKYRVVVVSDGSDDATNAIVSEFDDQRLKFIPLGERRGKASALNTALQDIHSDYVVFTDANVFLEENAVQTLVRAAAEPSVGAVTGRVELESIQTKEPLGESIYMHYERFIQSLESRVWSVAGVDGALFVVRRELVCRLPEDTILDDFTIGIGVALQGHRVCYEPAASAVEQVPAEVSQEFRRKTRIAAGCFQFLSRLDWEEFRRSPFRFKLALVSHKLIRWYVPFFLILVILSNLVLLGSAFFQSVLILQALVYVLAMAAAAIPALRRMKLSYIAYYFVAMNLAFLAGWFRQKSAGQSVTWSRVDR